MSLPASSDYLLQATSPVLVPNSKKVVEAYEGTWKEYENLNYTVEEVEHTYMEDFSGEDLRPTYKHYLDYKALNLPCGHFWNMWKRAHVEGHGDFLGQKPFFIAKGCKVYYYCTEKEPPKDEFKVVFPCDMRDDEGHYDDGESSSGE